MSPAHYEVFPAEAVAAGAIDYPDDGREVTAGEWHYRRRAANGETTDASEGYSTKANAVRAAQERAAVEGVLVEVLDADGDVVKVLEPATDPPGTRLGFATTAELLTELVERLENLGPDAPGAELVEHARYALEAMEAEPTPEADEEAGT